MHFDKKVVARLPRRGKRPAPPATEIGELVLELPGADVAYLSRLASRATSAVPPEIKGADLSAIDVPKGRKLKVRK